MNKLICILVLLPLLGLGQGIRFENGLNWQQIQEKAKAENKYIFVDCYANWSGPCKAMAKDVYPNDSVSRFMNDKFISVKVKMDTSEGDDEAVKAWYTDAHSLMITYKINAFPSFLFFSPEGKILHRDLGYKKPADFVQIAANATDPGKQYYTLLQSYRSGTKDYVSMRYLANSAREFNEPEQAATIAADYLHNYLDKLSFEAICTRDNLNFMATFAGVLTSKDKVFDCLYHHPALPDSALHNPDFAKRFVNYMATKEEITPVVEAAKKDSTQPDWDRISRHIKRQFGAEYVEKNIVRAKVDWYKSVKDWKNYTKWLIHNIDMEDIRKLSCDFWGRYSLNNAAWDVFQDSDDTAELSKALAWSEQIVEMEQESNGGDLDTKANLLYKLGKKDEALTLETKAVSLDPKNKGISENFHKMQHGEPTWVVKN